MPHVVHTFCFFKLLTYFHLLTSNKVITHAKYNIFYVQLNFYNRHVFITVTNATNATPNEQSEPMEVDLNHSDITVSLNKSTVLRGHDSEVFICAWNPVQDLLASG